VSTWICEGKGYHLDHVEVFCGRDPEDPSHAAVKLLGTASSKTRHPVTHLINEARKKLSKCPGNPVLESVVPIEFLYSLLTWQVQNISL
jgi:hypothetical protein